MAALQGPADLEVAVLAAPDTSEAWAWATWLPHARSGDGTDLVAATTERADAVADHLLVPRPSGPRRVVVVDDDAGLAARRSAARRVLRAATDPGARLTVVVLTPPGGPVPATCHPVLAVEADGGLRGPAELLSDPGALVGCSVATAASAARALARLDDPEGDEPGRSLPDEVGLHELLPDERRTAVGLAAAWARAGADPAPTALLGRAVDGPLVLDLAADGPHALVAGTTGAGKSELLRTLVASLATSSSPDHLAFVLIDFKGGSAFDACARLPHVTGW